MLFANGRWREEKQVQGTLCIATTWHLHHFPLHQGGAAHKLGLGQGREQTNIWTDPKRAGSAGWVSSAACLTSCCSAVDLFLLSANRKLTQHFCFSCANALIPCCLDGAFEE